MAINTSGDIVAKNFIVSSSVTNMTQSFSSGSTVFGDTVTDTHVFTGSAYIYGDGARATINSGDFIVSKLGGAGSSSGFEDIGFLSLLSGGVEGARIGAHSAISTYFNGGNVGIGTSAADSKLHIFKATAGSISAHADSVLTVENSGMTGINLLSGTTSHGQIMFGDSGDADKGVIGYDQSSDRMYILTNGSTTKRFSVESDGDIGINTTSPSAQLAGANRVVQIKGELVLEDGAGNSTYLALGGAQNAKNYVMSTGAIPLHIRTNSTDAIVIDATQNVGIGTTVPDGKLHVFNGSAGTVTAHSENDDFIIESSGNTGMTLVGPDANDIGIGWGSVSLNRAVLGKWNYDANSFRLRTNRASAVMVLGGGESLDTLTLDASGNTTLGGNLTVSGTTTFNTDGDSAFSIIDAGSNAIQMKHYLQP